MARTWPGTGFRRQSTRRLLPLALPGLIWAAALVSLFGAVVWSGLPDRSKESGVFCRIEQVASPPGLGEVSHKPDKREVTLALEPGSGRGIMVFDTGRAQAKQCGSLLVLGNFSIPVGYEVSIFKRAPDGRLHQAPIETAWMTSSVYDLEKILPGGIKTGTEWGLSVQPIDAAVVQTATSDNVISFSQPALSPPNVSTVSAMFLTQWTRFHPWSGQSINVLSEPGGDGFTWRRPTFIVGLSLLVAIVVAIALFRNNPRRLVLAIVPPIIASWLLVDTGWQHNLSLQWQETSFLYQDDPEPTVLASESDRRLAAIAQDVKELTADSREPILIVGPDPFHRARLYYHLLPRNAVMVSHGLARVHYERSPERLSGAYVVLIDGSAAEFAAETGRLRAEPDVSIPVKTIAKARDWMLLRISSPREGNPST